MELIDPLMKWIVAPLFALVVWMLKRIEAKATWVDGQRVRRDSPVLALIAAEQGVTDEQLDALFGISP